MTPNWARAQEIFLAAVDLSPEERQRYLDTACAGDAEMRREVESLLSYSDPEQDNLSSVIGDTARSIVDGSSLIGTRLGPWKILKQINHGGMSLVYLAERADGQYSQQVALKLIRPELTNEEFLRRFQRERQILAQLNHPYIAHLIDGGIAPDGRPYFAMEFVNGQPIDDFTRVRQVEPGASCRLMTLVCEAVSYAHSKGIIHRDLKPGNILICEDATPRLLDFGIAKILDTQPDAETTQTAAGWLLTPEYASPEQIKGEPVTPATDVYCLGGVLYAMLTGQKPHQFTGTDPLEIRKVICDVEVPSPSSRLAKSAADYAVRHKEMKGDLDAIVLKAMRKDAASRYLTAASLEDDLRRYLEKRPVSARKNVWSYRVSRFVRGHKGSILAALLFLVGIAMAAGYSAAGRRRAEAQRLYDAARGDMTDYTDAGVRRAYQRLEESVALDPGFAPGHAALAEAASWLGMAPGGTRPEYTEAGRREAQRALEIDPKLPLAHSVLGDILFFRDWRWEEGARELLTAARGDPKRVAWQVSYLKALTVLGRFEEGLAFLDQAERQEPGEIDLLVQRALLLFYLHRWEASMEVAQRVAEQDPTGVDGVWVLGMGQVQAGSTAEGIRTLESGLNRHHRDTRLEAALGNAYGLADRPEQAKRMLEVVIHPPNIITRGMCYVCGALIEAGMGNAAGAVEWLEKAWKARDGSIPFVPVDPRYSRIKDDPRFLEMVQRIRRGNQGLPTPPASASPAAEPHPGS